MTPASSLETDLVAQLRVPGGWEVLVGGRVAAGWLGAIHAPLAVLAPGPGGAAAHRTQLVVFVVSHVPPAGGAGDDGRAPAAEGGDHALDPNEEGSAHALALAAAAGIPEAWRIDRTREWTEVFRAPWDGRYRSRTLCLPGEAIVPLALSRLRVVPISRRFAR